MRPGHRGPAASFCVIPARFERATRSLEGCCSIQLSYGTIGKYAAQRTICAAKIGKVFHNSPRQSKKSHLPHGGNMPSMRKRRIDRTSGNTPQKPWLPVPERHPRHNRPTCENGRRHRRQQQQRQQRERQQRETAGDGRHTGGKRLASGGCKRKRQAAPRETAGAGTSDEPPQGPGNASQPAGNQPFAAIFPRIILPGGIFCLHLQA